MGSEEWHEDVNPEELAWQGMPLGGDPRPFNRKKAEALPKDRRMRACRMKHTHSQGFRQRGI